MSSCAAPKNAILSIQNNLSGRRIGQPATELGLACIHDPAYPAVISNYANQFADGRKVKSTAIGIRHEAGEYVAAICLNVDLTLFGGFQAAISQFTAIESGALAETLDAAQSPRRLCSHPGHNAARTEVGRAQKSGSGHQKGGLSGNSPGRRDSRRTYGCVTRYGVQRGEVSGAGFALRAVLKVYCSTASAVGGVA